MLSGWGSANGVGSLFYQIRKKAFSFKRRGIPSSVVAWCSSPKILFTIDSSSVVSTALCTYTVGTTVLLSFNRSHLMGDRNLPHRDQAGALTFVTFWRADSMPKQVVDQWHNEIEQWLQQNKLGGKSVNAGKSKGAQLIRIS